MNQAETRRVLILALRRKVKRTDRDFQIFKTAVVLGGDWLFKNMIPGHLRSADSSVQYGFLMKAGPR